MPFEIKHIQLLEKFAAKFGLPNRGDDHARNWTKQCAEQFAFSFPNEGWGTKQASPTRPPSTDVICRKENGRLIGYDLVVNAGIPEATLSANPHAEDITDQVFIPVTAKNHLGVGQPVTDCALGASFFPALGLRRHDRHQYNRFLNWFDNVLQPDSVRIFYFLAGGPWEIVGTGNVSDGTRQSLLAEVIEDLLAINIRPQITVFGTAVTGARLEQLTNQFIQVVRPYAPSCFLCDCVNEPGAIGMSYDDTRIVGQMIADANLKFPLLSLGSPDSLHIGVDGREATDQEVIDDAQSLYRRMPSAVNAITPHWGRHPWHPHRNLGLPHLKVINDEPRGWKSSVDEISNPADFKLDYFSSANHGEVLYNLHMDPLIWTGYCDDRNNPEWSWHNEVDHPEDVPRINEIVAALHEIRGGEIIIVPGDDMPKNPYPDEHTFWKKFGEDAAKIYQENGVELTPEQLEAGVHFARTAYDLAVSMSPEESAKKHLQEIRDIFKERK